MPKIPRREGDLYKVLQVFDRTFEVRYGYYEAFEREKADPIPIYPDLEAEAHYTAQGYRLVTQMQDMCEHAEFRKKKLRDPCCGNCKHFEHGDELLGRCNCSQNMRQFQNLPNE